MRIFILTQLFFSAGLMAQEEAAAPKKMPSAAPEFFSAGYLLQVFLSLAVVIGLLFAVLWMLRRMNGPGRGAAGQLRVLTSVSLGQRERAVLISAGKQQILLGVAPGSVTKLHVFEEPVIQEVVSADAEGSSIRFADVWKQALHKRGDE